MKLIAVDGFIYSISDPLVVATVVLSGVPSITCAAGGAKICKDGFSAVVSNITVPSVGATIPDPGPYNVSFNASSAKVTVDGALVLLEGDKTGTINAIPQIPGTPSVPYPVAFDLSISVPGQIKAKAN